MSDRTIQDLKQKQALPLSVKILLTKSRIREWVNEWGEDGVYISFSGGKDSTALLHIAREDYPNMKAVFVNTGLEYPEIVKFVKTFDNVDIIKPKMNFKQVIEKYGYPFISKEVSKRVSEYRNAIANGKDVTKTSAYKEFEGISTFHRRDNEEPALSFQNKKRWKFLIEAPCLISHKCCNVMKKAPLLSYERETKRLPITGQTAAESLTRQKNWLLYGCNAFEAVHPKSNPLSFWTEQDILHYLKNNNIPIASVYGDIVIDYEAEEQLSGQIALSDFGLLPDTRPLKTSGLTRTGCMFCGFGCHLEKPGEGRFELMKVTHPKIYDYIMRPKEQGGLNYKEIIDWINEHGDINIRY